jgi:hypothetical protein
LIQSTAKDTVTDFPFETNPQVEELFFIPSDWTDDDIEQFLREMVWTNDIPDPVTV